jgi:hypothetical protein
MSEHAQLQLARFANATIEHAIAAERERCAKIALEQGNHLGEPAIGFAIAKAIRAELVK